MSWIEGQDDYFLHKYGQDNGGTADDTPHDARPTDSQPADGGDTGAAGQFTFPDGQVAPADDAADLERRRRRTRFTIFLLILLAVGLTALYVRYYVPYKCDTLTTGYITLVEKRGLFFKTYEGEMITTRMLTDTTHVYRSDLTFAIPDDSLARLVQACQGTGRPVTVTTQRYYGTLPWRGDSPIVLTAIQPAP